ncbi:MAG: hypothetical protein AB7O56_03295 [Bauldia sp.]
MTIALLGGASLPTAAQEVAVAVCAGPAAVCADPTLTRQQELVTEHYGYLMANAPAWATLEISRDQAAFLQRRDACGTDTTCLGRAYTVRLISLYGWYECLRTDLPPEA